MYKLYSTAYTFEFLQYLGLMNLSGIDMFNRIILFFVPKKYFPDRLYCQEVIRGKKWFFLLTQKTYLLGFPMAYAFIYVHSTGLLNYNMGDEIVSTNCAGIPIHFDADRS